MRTQPEPAVSIPPSSPPPGFVPYRRTGPYIELIGPIYEAEQDDPLVVGLWLSDKHTNARGFVHAGVLVALADTVIGHSIMRKFPDAAPIVTVSLTTDFTGIAHKGTWLTGQADVTHSGSRLSFAGAIFRAEDRVVMTASGIFASLPAT